MSLKKKDLISGIFFLVVSIWMYAESYNIKMTKADSLGPQFFPRLVAILMALLAVTLIISSIIKIKKEVARGIVEDKKPFKLSIPLVLTVAILIAYVMLIEYVGFIVITIIYLFVQIFLLLPTGSIKNKKYIVITSLTSVLVTIGIYFLFYKVFQIFLPPGILG